MYEANTRKVWKQLKGNLSGTPAGLVAVVLCEPLAPSSTTALEKSFNALGFGTDCCTYISCEGLAGTQLFNAIEGNDPVVLVASDTKAASALEGAYHQPVKAGILSHIAGRSAVCFEDFNSLMNSNDSKQRAWALLKQLPKFGEI